jgi:RNA polymerase sigma factor (sigma-70 family)
MVQSREADMARTMVCGLPAGLRGMLEELASADAAADQRWILTLLEQHGPGVVNTLWRMLGREQDVLDAYQNVVCQLAARGPNGGGTNRAAYFYRSAINAGIELMRRRRREHDRLPKVAERCGPKPTATDSNVNVEHLHIVERMRAAILELPGHLRDVIVLRDLSGLDYRRVSAIMHISGGTARVYRRQAVIRLAAKLAREDRDEGTANVRRG